MMGPGSDGTGGEKRSLRRNSLSEPTEGSALMDHLERALGPFSGRGVAAPEWELPFSVWAFDDRPEQGVTAHVTFGISTHLLTGSDGTERRQELLLTLRPRWDETAVDIAANVGAYLLDRHVALLEGETVGIPLDLGTGIDRLLATRPLPFAPPFGRCEAFEPPVELIWLVPFAAAETHIATDHGVRELLDLLEEAGADAYDLARRPIS